MRWPWGSWRDCASPPLSHATICSLLAQAFYPWVLAAGLDRGGCQNEHMRTRRHGQREIQSHLSRRVQLVVVQVQAGGVDQLLLVHKAACGPWPSCGKGSCSTHQHTAASDGSGGGYPVAGIPGTCRQDSQQAPRSKTTGWILSPRGPGSPDDFLTHLARMQPRPHKNPQLETWHRHVGPYGGGLDQVEQGRGIGPPHGHQLSPCQNSPSNECIESGAAGTTRLTLAGDLPLERV